MRDFLHPSAGDGRQLRLALSWSCAEKRGLVEGTGFRAGLLEQAKAGPFWEEAIENSR